MATYIYKLRFKSPLQVFSDALSMGKPDVVIHSDTLFSAIANSIVAVFGNVPEGLFSSPKFFSSSAFPYSDSLLFFPRPRVFIPTSDQSISKKIKKTEFVSQEIFLKLLSGETIDLGEENFHSGGFLSFDKLQDEVFTIQEIPRCRIKRISGETEIFYSQRVRFAKDAGLFFLVKFLDTNFKSTVFDPALAYLSDTGIGGDRSIGNGQFEFSCEKFDLPEIDEKTKYFTNLSLYCPTKDEIDEGILNNAKYSMTRRQNWIYSEGPQPIRSKSIWMFTEGGVFRSVPKVRGRIIETTPQIAGKYIDHSVYRCGLLFGVPISENQMEA